MTVAQATREKLGLTAFASLQNYGEVRFVREGDWMDDLEQWENRCIVCEARFEGHRQRSICRVCASLVK
jgi:rRNA maturation endonuclease Nob1